MDKLTPPTRAIRRTMQGNRGRDTKPEVVVRSLLHASGLRFRVAARLPFDRRRSADIHFPRAGLYVFIDGCFWHGCPEHYIAPRNNAEFWAHKVETNRSRDQDTSDRLRAEGFEVLRFWEHEPPDAVAEQIRRRYLDLRKDRRSDPSSITRSPKARGALR